MKRFFVLLYAVLALMFAFSLAACDLSESTEPIACDDHTYGEWKVTKEPTCADEGRKKRSCIVCTNIESSDIPPKGHRYSFEIIPPTALKEGYTLYTCEWCSDCYKDQVVPPTNNFVDDIGEYDFGGRDFVIAVDSNYRYELFADEDSRETVDQYVYQRNLLMQQRFNVHIVANETQAVSSFDSGSHYDYINRSLMRAEVEFDMITLPAGKNGRLATSGYFLDWRTETRYCKNSILSGNVWWPKELNTAATILGHQYFAVSDMCLTGMEMCSAILFNKDIEKNAGIAQMQFSTETLYQAVEEGKWTLDSFYNIVKLYDFSSDENDMANKQDIVGLVAGLGADADAWAFALGYSYIENDGVHMPELSLVSGAEVVAIQTLRNLLYNSGTCILEDETERTQFFIDGQALFNLSSMRQLKAPRFADMESDYGILPYPKRDANQKQYLTGMKDSYTMISIPYFNFNMEMTDVLVEAMSAESYHSIKDAYALSTQEYNDLIDLDIYRMVDIIMRGRRCDLTTYHPMELSSDGGGTMSLALLYRRLLQDQSLDIVDHYSDYCDSYEEHLTWMLDDYLGLFS
ncbi:MAG: hypothetical protein IJY20_06245 [Clostridia bacterium]|nr:hypothetical protein [Clostridia bacterium]